MQTPAALSEDVLWPWAVQPLLVPLLLQSSFTMANPRSHGATAARAF